MTDEFYMQQALQQAYLAKELDEVPVGAVVVCKGRIISKAHNLTEKLTDVTAHAEMQAITSAANFLGSKYLNQCTIYVTLEPCVMCAGALAWSQIDRVVFGASDDKKGFSLINNSILHAKTEVVSGVNEQECSQLLSDFFAQKRS